jgi:hypothetical protein
MPFENRVPSKDEFIFAQGSTPPAVIEIGAIIKVIYLIRVSAKIPHHNNPRCIYN